MAHPKRKISKTRRDKMNNQENRKNVALPEDLAEDIDYIAEMLTQQTGAKIGRTNAIRAAAKAWFDANNNG